MEFLFPLVSFAFVTSVTPGPNNLLLLSSGLRFGFVRSLPHILGIQFGVALQLFFCGLGVGLVFERVPSVYLILKVLGTGYLMYLAWNLRSSSFDSRARGEGRPFTFTQAVLFQFINPKAWMMTITAGTLFLPDLSSGFLAALLLCLIFNSVGAPSSGSWALLGGYIRQYLNEPKWQRIFSTLMIVLTLYTALALWFF